MINSGQIQRKSSLEKYSFLKSKGFGLNANLKFRLPYQEQNF